MSTQKARLGSFKVHQNPLWELLCLEFQIEQFSQPEFSFKHLLGGFFAIFRLQTRSMMNEKCRTVSSTSPGSAIRTCLQRSFTSQAQILAHVGKSILGDRFSKTIRQPFGLRTKCPRLGDFKRTESRNDDSLSALTRRLPIFPEFFALFLIIRMNI